MRFDNSDIEPFSLWDLAAGIFHDRNKVDIPDQGASSVSNMLNLYGKLKPRAGFNEVYTTAPKTDPVAFLGQRRPLTSNTSTLLAAYRDGTDFYLYEYDGVSTWNDRSSGGIAGAMANGVYPMGVNFKGDYFITTGDDELLTLKVGASSLTEVQADQSNSDLKPPEKPRLLAVAPDRLFLANVYDDDAAQRVPYRLHWCDHLAPATWGYGIGAGTAGYTDLAEDNTPITAIYAHSDTLTIFKPHLVYFGRLTGGAKTFDYRILADGPGCVAHRTLQRYRDNKFIYLGDENVYMARPGELPQAIGNQIKPCLSAYVDRDSISEAMAVIDLCKDLYWLFLPSVSDSELRTYLVCNLLTGAWYEGEIHSSIVPTACGMFREELWQKEILVGTYGGKTMHFSFDYTDDDGQTIAGHWHSKVFSTEKMTQGASQHGSIQTAKCFSEDNSEETIDIKIDTGDGLDDLEETDFGTQTFAPDEESFLTNRTSTSGGEFFKIKLEFSDAADCAEIQGIGLGWIVGGGGGFK